jgi:hypothetical protein
MTIHSPDKYIENIWDWGFLDECFQPTRIKVTDIDGLIERNGRFLVIETKLPNVDIPKGQAILFNALVKTGYFHVLIIWGKRNQPEHRMFWGYSRKIPTSTENVIELVRMWFQLVDAKAVLANEGSGL